MTLYYQTDDKIGLLVAKVAQKAFLIDISVIPDSHFKFCPLEKKCRHFWEGPGGLIFLGMVPETQFHHQNTLAEEWSWNWGYTDKSFHQLFK